MATQKTKFVYKTRWLRLIKALYDCDDSISITRLAQKSGMARITIKKTIDYDPSVFKIIPTAENRTYIKLNRDSIEVQKILSGLKILWDDDVSHFNAVM